jgi:hypothetical protein
VRSRTSYRATSSYQLPLVATHAHRVNDRQIRSLVLYVDLVGSRRIWPAHVGRLVDPVGSRPVPMGAFGLAWKNRW